MGSLRLVSDGVELSRISVVREAPLSSAPARSRTVTGAPAGTVVENDTFYKDPQGSLVYNNSLRRVSVTGAKTFTSQSRGWQDVWVEGKPGAPFIFGNRSDGGDGCQVKNYPHTADGAIPDRVVLRYFRCENISAQSTQWHPDGMQVMAGRNCRLMDGEFRNITHQCLFFKTNMDPASGFGPIEDWLIERVYIEHPKPFGDGTVSFNGLNISEAGSNVPKRVVLRDCIIESWNIDAGAAAAGCRIE